MGAELRTDKTDVPAGWKPAVRVDVGRLRKAQRTPSGGVRVPGAVAREGILEYRRADGSTIRELVLPEEARRLESLATLRDAVVTVGHPAGGTRLVSPETFRDDSVGHVSGDPRVEEGHVVADLVILDAKTIARIDGDELCELSSGYRVWIDPTPGEWNGQRYDAVQRNREYNHVALLPRGGGRAGATVSLRLDGEDIDAAAQVRVDGEERRPPAPEPDVRTDMKTERIDGVDYEVGSAPWAQARAKHEQQTQARIDALEAQVAAAAKTEAERDALRKQVAELETKLAASESPERVDALVVQRVDLVERARAVLGADAKLVREDGKPMTEKDIVLAALAKAAPELKLDGRSDDYLRARFEAETDRARKESVSPSFQARGDAFRAPAPPAGDASPHTLGRTPPPSL